MLLRAPNSGQEGQVMRDSDQNTHHHMPEHFYRAERGAQNRGHATALMHERTGRFRPADAREVMFIVLYEDGRLSYITVSNRELRNGDRAALTLALAKQHQGGLPDGTIVDVRRVH